MYELFSSITESNMTFPLFTACIAAALLCGGIVAVLSWLRSRISSGFFTSLVLLPPIVCVLLLMVNSNIGTGIAVAGAFSLVRFRSVPGRAKDIVSIFLSMTAGLACAAGYIWVALVFTAAVSLAAFGLSFIKLNSDDEFDLKITVPESLNFINEFDDLLGKYTLSHRLLKVKTCNMGSLYKIEYKISMKRAEESKMFLDELRCRNGNLEITLCEAGERSDEL